MTSLSSGRNGSFRPGRTVIISAAVPAGPLQHFHLPTPFSPARAYITARRICEAGQL